MARRSKSPSSEVELLNPKDLEFALDPELAGLVQPYLERQARAVGAVGGWPFLSTQGGVFSRGEVQLDSFDCIVLAHCRMNSFYKGVYNPARRDSPDCWAIQGMEQLETDLAPPPELPMKQAEKCFGCPQNEFGSDLRGRGKACKNIHVLALLPLENGFPDPQEVARIQGLRLRIPPTSQRWGKVVQKLGSGKTPIPSCFVRMHFSIAADDKTQFQIEPFFEPKKDLIRDRGLQRALWARVEEAEQQIRQQPPARAALPEGKAVARLPARGARTAVVRRRSAK